MKKWGFESLRRAAKWEPPRTAENRNVYITISKGIAMNPARFPGASFAAHTERHGSESLRRAAKWDGTPARSGKSQCLQNKFKRKRNKSGAGSGSQFFRLARAPREALGRAPRVDDALHFIAPAEDGSWSAMLRKAGEATQDEQRRRQTERNATQSGARPRKMRREEGRRNAVQRKAAQNDAR